MPDRPQGLLPNAPARTDVSVCPPPQASGKGSGRPLAAMSLTELRGVAATAFDPMRGHILSESDPRAKALLAAQEERVRKLQGKAPRKRDEWSKGQRVFHARRKEYGFISASSTDNKRIEVQFSKGRALVQIANLSKV